MSRPTKADTTSYVISLLLVYGVLLSAVLIAVGLALLLINGNSGYPGLPVSWQLPREAHAFRPHSLAEISGGVLGLKSFALIELGLLVLIATPVFRVAASIVLFWLENDKLYAGITTVVLGVLLVSLFWIG